MTAQIEPVHDKI